MKRAQVFLRLESESLVQTGAAGSVMKPEHDLDSDNNIDSVNLFIRLLIVSL